MAGTLPNVVTQFGIGSAGLHVAWVWLGVAVVLWLYSEQTRPGIHSRPIRWQPARFSSGRSPGVPAQLAAFIMAAVWRRSVGSCSPHSLAAVSPQLGSATC